MTAIPKPTVTCSRVSHNSYHMPNLPMHIHLAGRVADHLGWGWVKDHAGSLYLGSTAPDIRAMTKWPRERTHFAPLSVDEVGIGPRAMFRRHPNLADHNGLSHATRAFLIGYISHLVADEAWISQIYRPYFDPHQGNGRVTGTEVEANMWDRALQLDMDRNAIPNMDGLLQDSEAFTHAHVDVEVGFLNESQLEEWRDWVSRFLSWEFSWDRLKRALNRMYRDDDAVQNTVDSFIQNMPGSLNQVYEKIPQVKIDAYQQGALKETLAQVRERWSEA